MNIENEYTTIRNFVKANLPASGSHGVDHTLRVTRLCEKIGSQEEADMQILIPAALLHDIARPLEDETGKPHEIEGARIAEEYLRTIAFPDSLITPITDAILTHRFRSDLSPKTPEGQILSDADKLDAMGAVGIARAFLTAGERGGDITDAINHIEEKLLNLQSLMYTASARKQAAKKHEELERFLSTLRDELSIH